MFPLLFSLPNGDKKYYDFWRKRTYLFTVFFVIDLVIALFVHLYYKHVKSDRIPCLILLIVFSVGVLFAVNGAGGEYDETTALVVPLFAFLFMTALFIATFCVSQPIKKASNQPCVLIRETSTGEAGKFGSYCWLQFLYRRSRCH